MSDSRGNEIVCYLLVRRDLKMPVGKVAAQVGHGVQALMKAMLLTNGVIFIDDPSGKGETHEVRDCFRTWDGGSMTKVALGVEDEAELNQIFEQLDGLKIPYLTVTDEGRTHVEPGTVTCAVVNPLPKLLLKPILGRLRLL